VCKSWLRAGTQVCRLIFASQYLKPAALKTIPLQSSLSTNLSYYDPPGECWILFRAPYIFVTYDSGPTHKLGPFKPFFLTIHSIVPVLDGSILRLSSSHGVVSLLVEDFRKGKPNVQKCQTLSAQISHLLYRWSGHHVPNNYIPLCIANGTHVYRESIVTWNVRQRAIVVYKWKSYGRMEETSFAEFELIPLDGMFACDRYVLMRKKEKPSEIYYLHLDTLKVVSGPSFLDPHLHKRLSICSSMTSSGLHVLALHTAHSKQSILLTSPRYTKIEIIAMRTGDLLRRFDVQILYLPVNRQDAFAVHFYLYQDGLYCTDGCTFMYVLRGTDDSAEAYHPLEREDVPLAGPAWTTQDPCTSHTIPCITNSKSQYPK
jgi:hypothetical protein